MALGSEDCKVRCFSQQESIHLRKLWYYLSDLGEFVFMDELLEVVPIFRPSGSREDSVHVGDGHLEIPRDRMLESKQQPSETQTLLGWLTIKNFCFF